MLPDVTQPLSREAAADAFAAILDGKYPDEEVGPFLVALNDRGETADEIAAAAREMRVRLVAIEAPAAASDVCGTGGGGRHSLTVPTALALAVATDGLPVATHGHHAATSGPGTAHHLQDLG